MPVHECQPRQDLQHDDLDCVFGEMGVAIFDELVEVLLHVLENEVENVVLPNHLLEFHDVCVGKFFQRLEKFWFKKLFKKFRTFDSKFTFTSRNAMASSQE